MPLVQSISFHAKRSYLAGFLQQFIDQSGISASVQFDGKRIRLDLDDADGPALERFSSLINSSLPHSLFIGEIENSHTDTPVSPARFQSESYELPLCPTCLRSLFDKNSPDYLNANLRCGHYGAPLSDDTTLPIDIEQSIRELLNGNSVTLGGRTYRTAYQAGDTLMLTNPSALNKTLLLSQEEIKALLSIEKPVLTLALQDENLIEEIGQNVIKAKLFDDAPSILLSQRLNTEGTDHLFFAHSDEMEAMVYKDRTHIIRPGNLADTPEKLNDDPVISHFLNMVGEFDLNDISSVGGCMQSSGIWHFIHRSAKVSKPIIRFSPFESNGLIQKLTDSSDARKRLMDHFKSDFPDNYNALERLSEQADTPLFDMVAAIFGIQGGFEAVSNTSLAFTGNGGVKVDAKFGDGSFDYLSFLASLISFKLAGVENTLLSYSLFESLADLATDTLSQLKSRLKTEEVILFGDLMANTPFYSRIERNLGNAAPHISSRYPLDVQA